MKVKKGKNLKKFKQKTIQLSILGIFIFCFGIFVGYQLRYGTIFSLEGYLFNAVGDATSGDATSGDATSGDATSGDATSGDATSGDATSGDATSGNATANDNVLSLNSFSLKTSNAKTGEKVYVSMSTNGACVNSASIILKNTTTNETFTATMHDVSSNPYFVVPNGIKPTNYRVTDVLLVGLNSNRSTFSKQYSLSPTSSSVTHYNFNSPLTVTEVKMPAISLTSLTFDSTTAPVNGKVNISVKTSSTLVGLKLILLSTGTNKTMTVYAKSLSSKPYFVIPSTTVAGTYNLVTAVLTTSNNTTIYSKDTKVTNSLSYSFKSYVKVSNASSTNALEYNNEDINEKVITDISNAPSNAIITVNANTNPIVNANLFNAVKGTNKQIILNYYDNQMILKGNNIEEVKTINASLYTLPNDSNQKIYSLINNGVVIDTASNGDLPGDTLVRVRIDEKIASTLGSDPIYVYSYDKYYEKFAHVANSVKPTDDGYYEFTVSNDASYVLVKSELDSSLLIKKTLDEEIVSFLKSNSTYLIIIMGSILVIVVVVVIIVTNKRKGKTSKNSI